MSKTQKSRHIIGPINRVEGDLEVKIEVEDKRISNAWVNAPLFRGFEQILHGKDPRDAMVYTPRICGICSISQSVASAQAIAEAQGIQPLANGQLATNLILATENLADHLTHFYLFFMPDFAREQYSNHHWYHDIAQRFKAQTGHVTSEVVPARAAFLHLTGLLAGKWPHSLAIQPGGTSRPVQAHEIVRILNILNAFRYFLETTLFDDTLENVTTLDCSQALSRWQHNHSNSDFGRFLMLSDALSLEELGRTQDRFLSYGVYTIESKSLFCSGIWQDDERQALQPALIREDLTNSWLHKGGDSKHPYQGETIPDAEMSDGYSWCKAPRLDGKAMEVGALARQVVNGQPLIVDLIRQHGSNVKSRVVARLLELALIVPQMQRWANMIQPGSPFCETLELPDQAQGAGMIEAARGSLGHWLCIENSRISNYQIIAPTTWNFSPRDQQNQTGPLETALLGTRLSTDSSTAVEIQHIIRSFDPCMVCTVH